MVASQDDELPVGTRTRGHRIALVDRQQDMVRHREAIKQIASADVIRLRAIHQRPSEVGHLGDLTLAQPVQGHSRAKSLTHVRVGQRLYIIHHAAVLANSPK